MSTEKPSEIRVLIIEDSDDDALIVLRRLRRESFQVVHQRVETERALRQALSENSWDLVICDHMLPSLDAFSALKLVREASRLLPFIVVSGKIGEDAAVEVMRAGAQDYIMKDRLQRLGPAVERELAHVQERQLQHEAEDRLEAQLRESQKMEAIGRLAAGIAHDFNNFLMVIKSYTSVLLNEIEAENTWRDDVSEMRDAGDRAAELVRQLLVFSRTQPLNPELVDLGQAVSNLEHLLTSLVGDNINIHLHIDSGLGKIEVDKSQLESVVMNLAANARDAIAETGNISIMVTNVSLSKQAADQVGNLLAGEYVRLSVSDDGSGMDPVTLTRIFEPFYTTRANSKGTGLGLAIVYGIVTQSGGGIEVDSEPGNGSAFHVYFKNTSPAEANSSESA